MKRFLFPLVGTILLLPGTAGAQTAQQKKMGALIDKTLEASIGQTMMMYETVKELKASGTDRLYPVSAEHGELVASKEEGWTSGFMPGTLWYLYEYSNDENLRTAAAEMTGWLSAQQFNDKSHDVGFIMNCSFGNAYRLTGKEEYRTALVHAGESLAKRFVPEAGITRSWSRRMEGIQTIVIIDNMMNLEVLGVSSSLSGDNTCYHIAKSHADRTMENHFRPDGSSYHLVSYDSVSGKMHRRITYQGVSDDSAWSRGQAWGLYGFVMMYRQTGEQRYLDLAIKAGQYIMNHPNMPKDKIPYWDFFAPAGPQTPRDASAAAVMASAYVELCTYVDGELAGQFRTIAEQMITSLASPAYFAKKGTNNHFLLKHSTGFYAKNREVDAPLSYADYYFVEAMMRYRHLLQGRPAVDVRTAYSENPDRAVWLSSLDRVARPLLTNMAKGELKKNMPVESRADDINTRYKVTYLEGLGRLITGIAPWLELGPDATPEGRLRAEYIDLALKSITHGVDPASPDYLNFNEGRQPLVDAAFLAHGLLRARTQLWDKLDAVTQQRILKELASSRVIKPSETNWLFFAAMVECAIREFGGEWEFERVKYAMDRHKSWYKGDGWYGDGAEFHLDYYNSFVIQPMMMQVLETLEKFGMEGADFMEIQQVRYARYGEQQERLVSPEGTYPAVGRSLAYRFGAFQALSDVCYRHLLPTHVDPAQARGALTAVIRNQTNAPGTFDGYGWLRPGFCGYQPSIGEGYISTGSLYLCAGGYVALGLPAADPFWSRPAADWTGRKAWGGIDIPVDKALKQ